MSKFKVGDKPTVKQNLKAGRPFGGGYIVTDSMARLSGKQVEVIEVDPAHYGDSYRVKGSGCFWRNECFEDNRMNEIEQHVMTINVMQSAYRHIRHSDAEFLALEAAKEALREQAEREKPECWVKKETDGGMLAICPKCNYPISWWHKTNYCPNCGAKMEDKP